VNEERISEAFADQFEELKRADLKVSRAWALKELVRDFWTYNCAGWAKRHFDKWYAWAIRSRLEPIKEKARMIRDQLPNILTYFKQA
ncbi:MAG: transposase, partial [Candidatus Thiodiazotropha sp.]